MENPEIDHLSEREILILVCRDLREVKKLGPRVRALENWRTGLTGAWVALSGTFAGYLALVRARGTHP